MFFYLYKLTTQSQKKINFWMPLYCKYCKDKAIVPKFDPICFIFFLRRLKFRN